MIGVSRPREREQRDSHEAEVFKKCQACQTRPASIRCEDCLRDRHPDLMCYGCSRRVHSEQSHHAYEYATFRDMLLPEDERSLQESDCFPADNLFKLESKASKPYYEASIDPTTNEHSLVAAVDIYTPPTDSPAKKQYQTFGRRSDITLQAKQSDIGSKRVDKLHPTYDKENFKRNNQPSEENQSSNSGRKRGLAQPNLRSSKQLSQHQSAVDQYSIKASAEKQKYLRPAHESAQSREADYRKAKVPPRHDRQILREVTNYQVEDQSRHRDETGSLNVHKDRDARMLNSHSSKDRSGSRVEQRHESPNKSRDVQLVSTEPMSRGTPNKTPNKAAKEQRLLSGSSWKTRARPQSEQAHMLHSPAYLDSVTELHKTELDSLKTRHKVELDRLESELTNLAKNYDAEVKSLRSELRQTSEDASEVHHRNDELERVVENLRLQNGLLKEENQLLRESNLENSSKENELVDELNRMQSSHEADQQALRNKCLDDIDCVRQEYEEHFVEQISMYTENIRNKDNILRCKDEMIRNLERELERLRKLIDGGH